MDYIYIKELIANYDITHLLSFISGAVIVKLLPYLSLNKYQKDTLKIKLSESISALNKDLNLRYTELYNELYEFSTIKNSKKRKEKAKKLNILFEAFISSIKSYSSYVNNQALSKHDLKYLGLFKEVVESKMIENFYDVIKEYTPMSYKRDNYEIIYDVYNSKCRTFLQKLTFRGKY